MISGGVRNSTPIRNTITEPTIPNHVHLITGIQSGSLNIGGCPRGTQVEFDPTALHYSEITIKSTFHHTPRFIALALDTIASGEIHASDFVTGEILLQELPLFFWHLKHRNGELKTAVIP